MGCLQFLGSAVWQNAFILVLFTATLLVIQVPTSPLGDHRFFAEQILK